MATPPPDVKSIFGKALELTDPAARAAYLGSACGGNATLRAEVEGLLAALDQAGGFLNRPAPSDGPTATSAPAPDTASFDPAGPGGTRTADHPGKDEAVGTVIAGKYKLVEAIGEGGMGSVFLAQQSQPVKRLVAVKVIKAGMDSKAVLARFEAERQALAMMDHPNIARVLDAGTTDSGRPFFVMELVKGVPITKFCDDRKLTPRQRLELFVPVCQAIQHAHQKGVIHRDIKPSNVLVALYDDRPVPKVIDFGVAKATGPQLTEQTLVTGLGAVVGTPEYMSPEQASFNQLDVDTRSDVYALGVLLYELLVGTTPIDRKSLGQAALLEVLRMVREVEAPRPSTKLSTSDARPSISANRGLEPKKLTGLLRGELDWIVMKALEKDRARRYESANGFAADVQRYLAGEQVQAVPPSAGYRLRKFLRKHRGGVTVAAVVLLALTVGVVGTGWGLVEARKQRDDAESSRRDADTAREREVEERKKVEDREQRLAEQTVQLKARTNEAEAARGEANLELHDNQRTMLAEAWEGGEPVRIRTILDTMRPKPGRADLRGFESHFLDRLTHAEIDGTSFKVREPANTREIGTLGMPSPRIRVSISLAANRHYFAIDALDLSTGKAPVGFSPISGRFGSTQVIDPRAHIIPGDPARIVSAAHLAPDLTKGLPSENYPLGELTAWDFRTGRPIARCERLYPDAGLIAKGWEQRFSGNSFNLFDAFDRQTTRVITGMARTVPAEGERPAFTESRAQIHDLKTGRVVLLLDAKPGHLERAHYSFDDRYIVTSHTGSGGKPLVTVWDARSGRELWARNEAFLGFTSDGLSVAFPQPPAAPDADPSKPRPMPVVRLATGESIELPAWWPVFTHPRMPDDPFLLWDAEIAKDPSARSARPEKLFSTREFVGPPYSNNWWLNDREELVRVSPTTQGVGPPDAPMRETTFFKTTFRPVQVAYTPFQVPPPSGFDLGQFSQSGRGLQLSSSGLLKSPFLPVVGRPFLEFSTHSVLDLATGERTTVVLPLPPATDEATTRVATKLDWDEPVFAGNTVVRHGSGFISEAPTPDTVTHVPVLAVYDRRTGRERFVRRIPATRGSRFASQLVQFGSTLSPDGKFILIEDLVKKELMLLDAETGVTKWTHAADTVANLVWLRGGSHFGRIDQTTGALGVYDTATGELRHTTARLFEEMSNGAQTTLSPSGRWLTVVSGSQLALIDTESWAVRSTTALKNEQWEGRFGKGRFRDNQTVFTPDERTAVVTSFGGPLIVLDTGTGTIRHQLGTPTDADKLLEYREVLAKYGGLSNRFVLRQVGGGRTTSSGPVHTLEVWDLHSGELWSRFELRTIPTLSQFRFNNDGSRLFALCDGIVHIIDLRRGREVLRIPRGTLQKTQAQPKPTGNLSHLELSPDGHELTVYAYSPEGKSVRKEVFDARPLSEQELARSRQIAEAPLRVSPPTPEPPGPPKKPETASDYFDLATGLMGIRPGAAPKLDPKAAVAAYREAIRLDPDFFALHARLAAALSATGDDEVAVAAYREAVKRYPADVASWFQIGLILQRRGDRTGAIAAYRDALRHDDRNGIADAWQGMHGPGSHHIPPRGALHFNLANLLLQTEDPVGAERECREALRLQFEPTHGGTAQHLVRALIRQGKFPEAETEAKAFVKRVEEAARKDPNRQLNNTAEIERVMGSALEAMGHAYLWNTPARAVEAADWFEQAARRFTAFEKEKPGEEFVQGVLRNIHWNRAIALNWADRGADALEEMDLALKTAIPKDQPFWRMMRARYQAKTKDWPDAERAAAELLKTPPEPKPTWFLWDAALVHALCSRSAKEEKDRERHAATAVKLLERAVANGWDDLPLLGWDPDVQPLRDRADFKTLVEKLKSKHQPPREPTPPPREKK